MRKIQVFAVLLIVAFLTLGQEGCQTNQDTGLQNPFVGGTQGLQVQFEEYRPPEFIYDDNEQSFYVDVVLQNLGEAYVEGSDVKINIRGLQPDSFGVSAAQLEKSGINVDLYPMEKEEGRVIEPSEEYISFGPFSYQHDLENDFGPFNVRAEVCYKYQTEAVSLGCVLRDPSEPPEQAYCLIDEEKKVFNSGAPIQVTNFVESPAGNNRIKYVFTIEHLGTGRFFATGNQCSDEQHDEHKIHFAIDSRVQQLDCGQLTSGGMQGDVYLGRDGKIDISCIQQVAEDTDFQDQITITLTYDYFQLLETPFMVKAD